MAETLGAATGAATRIGDPATSLTDEQVTAFVADRLSAIDVDGRRVCVVVPDATRTCPLPLLVAAVRAAWERRTAHLTFVVALGTHAPLADDALAALLGWPAATGVAPAPGVTAVNHRWWEPATFVTLGTIGAERVAALTDGRLAQDVPVRVNRAVVDHDVTLIVGPVLPHEVVGFSGGNKYLFPGLSGPEMIDVSHWVGALLTSAAIIGTPGTTPVRALIDEAAALVPSTRLALCLVTGGGGLRSVSFGSPEAAWADAVDVSAEVHVRYRDAPVARVLSLVPERYDDLWTGAKGFYKVEPVVADGGEVVLLAPHITQVSAMHPGLTAIGYHNRDYFVGQWERFRHLPWGELAHATHLRGAGTWDPVTGEHHRVTVTLATGISEADTLAVGLAYRDPASIDVAAWTADPDTLVVPDAGEQLYRLRP